MCRGQDDNNLFITAYIPGVSVNDDKPVRSFCGHPWIDSAVQEFVINNSHFTFEASNPSTAEVCSLLEHSDSTQ